MLSDHKLRMAEKQATRMRQFFDAGLEMQTIREKDRVRRSEIAAKYGFASKRLTPASQFARQYSKAEFAELIGLRKPDGNLLHVGYIPFLLTLKWKTKEDKQIRAALQREAAKNGWTAAELADVIRWRYPKPVRNSGRKPKELPLALLIEEVTTKIRDLTALLQCSERVDPRHVASLMNLRSEVFAFAGTMPNETNAA